MKFSRELHLTYLGFAQVESAIRLLIPHGPIRVEVIVKSSGGHGVEELSTAGTGIGIVRFHSLCGKFMMGKITIN
jgi:hypothetical protein